MDLRYNMKRTPLSLMPGDLCEMFFVAALQRIYDLLRRRFVGQRGCGGFAGFEQHGCVLKDVGDLEIRQAVLARAEKLARAAQFEVFLGEQEAVSRLFKRRQALFGV